MYDRVVVPLDGSRIAESIVPFVMRFAGPLDTEVILVHVTADAGGTFVGYLASICSAVALTSIRVRAELRHGDPATEILAVAREARADFIAMTTHGRGGLSRFLTGSVAEKVLRQSTLPVFLLRLTESELARQRAAEATALPVPTP